MLALAPSHPSIPRPKRLTPNLLPCTIHHSGPIQTPRRYWSPVTAARTEVDGVHKSRGRKGQATTAYLRGRRLVGRGLRLPEGYTGLVLQKTDTLLPSKPRVPSAEDVRAMEERGLEDGDGGAEEQEAADVKTLERRAEFDELVVWDHEAVPEDEDAYVRGVEEWLGFAEAMHCDPPSATNATT